MEYLIEKVSLETVLTKFSAYVEADTLAKAIDKAYNNNNEIDWQEGDNEYINEDIQVIREKPL